MNKSGSSLRLARCLTLASQALLSFSIVDLIRPNPVSKLIQSCKRWAISRSERAVFHPKKSLPSCSKTKKMHHRCAQASATTLKPCMSLMARTSRSYPPRSSSCTRQLSATTSSTASLTSSTQQQIDSLRSTSSKNCSHLYPVMTWPTWRVSWPTSRRLLVTLRLAHRHPKLRAPSPEWPPSSIVSRTRVKMSSLLTWLPGFSAIVVRQRSTTQRQTTFATSSRSTSSGVAKSSKAHRALLIKRLCLKRLKSKT
mmetsp:Transcript_10839/g.13665  ORF Transcript_10839/g.13665 Transcript_10839/m.13665 type:complete len:254 (-) Transcript_10839:1156-1917(-)